jgi:hypothetical protein
LFVIRLSLDGVSGGDGYPRWWPLLAGLLLVVSGTLRLVRSVRLR